MLSADRYVTLISSLPPHVPSLFEARQTPISRIKLDERLLMLQPRDSEDLQRIENLMHWDRMPLGINDREMLQRGRHALGNLHSGFIREIVNWRLELRTLVAAMRRRRAGQTEPPSDNGWGYGRWLSRIRRNWHEPGFGLQPVFPWLTELERLFADGDHLAIERFLLGLAWEYYGRMSGDHYFDFEAVVVYVLRWDVIDRWSGYEGREAARRFDELVEVALEEYLARTGPDEMVDSTQ